MHATVPTSAAREVACIAGLLRTHLRARGCSGGGDGLDQLADTMAVQASLNAPLDIDDLDSLLSTNAREFIEQVKLSVEGHVRVEQVGTPSAVVSCMAWHGTPFDMVSCTAWYPVQHCDALQRTNWLFQAMSDGTGFHDPNDANSSGKKNKRLVRVIHISCLCRSHSPCIPTYAACESAFAWLLCAGILPHSACIRLPASANRSPH